MSKNYILAGTIIASAPIFFGQRVFSIWRIRYAKWLIGLTWAHLATLFNHERALIPKENKKRNVWLEISEKIFFLFPELSFTIESITSLVFILINQ